MVLDHRAIGPAKGPLLLGVKAVIVESYERIHRSNLAGMGILPLQFEPGDTRKSLELTGEEVFHINGLEKGVEKVEVVATRMTIASHLQSYCTNRYAKGMGVLSAQRNTEIRSSAFGGATKDQGCQLTASVFQIP